MGYFLHSYQCTLAPEEVHASRPLQEPSNVAMLTSETTLDPDAAKELCESIENLIRMTGRKIRKVSDTPESEPEWDQLIEEGKDVWETSFIRTNVLWLLKRCTPLAHCRIWALVLFMVLVYRC